MRMALQAVRGDLSAAPSELLVVQHEVVVPQDLLGEGLLGGGPLEVRGDGRAVFVGPEPGGEHGDEPVGPRDGAPPEVGEDPGDAVRGALDVDLGSVGRGDGLHEAVEVLGGGRLGPEGDLGEVDVLEGLAAGDAVASRRGDHEGRLEALLGAVVEDEFGAGAILLGRLQDLGKVVVEAPGHVEQRAGAVRLVRDYESLPGLLLRDPKDEPPADGGGEALLPPLEDDDPNPPRRPALLLDLLEEVLLRPVEREGPDVAVLGPDLEGLVRVEREVVTEPKSDGLLLGGHSIPRVGARWSGPRTPGRTGSPQPCGQSRRPSRRASAS